MVKEKKTSDSKSDLKGARPASIQRAAMSEAFRAMAASMTKVAMRPTAARVERQAAA